MKLKEAQIQSKNPSLKPTGNADASKRDGACEMGSEVDVRHGSAADLDGDEVLLRKQQDDAEFQSSFNAML